MAETVLERGSPAPQAAVKPSSAAPAVDSSLQAQQDFTRRVAEAKTPAEIKALVAQAAPVLKQQLLKKPEAPKTEVAVKPTPEAAPEAPVEAVEETPAADAPEATDEAPAADAAPESAGETAPNGDENADPSGEYGGDDNPVTPYEGTRAHLRLAKDDKVGRLAASYMRRNRDMPMEEAMEKAKTQLGIKPQSNDAKPTDSPNAAPNMPATLDATEVAIKAAREQRRKANVELRFEEATEISEKIEDLMQHRLTLERDAERKQASDAVDYNRKFAASEVRAVDLYEFASKPESEGGKRMREIEEDMELSNDPTFHSPDKPLIIAQMVAAEMRIAPRRKGTPAAPAKSAAPAAQPAKKQVLPSGGSRTTPVATNQPPAINSEISQITNPQQLREFRKKHGLPIH